MLIYSHIFKNFFSDCKVEEKFKPKTVQSNRMMNLNVRNYKTHNESIASSENHRNNSTVIISQPKLEKMTYKGHLCSLDEVNAKLDTFKHSTKPIHQVLTTLKRPSSFLSTSNSLQSTNVQQTNPNIIQPISIIDISEPKLQTMSNKQRLTDLDIVQKQNPKC